MPRCQRKAYLADHGTAGLLSMGTRGIPSKYFYLLRGSFFELPLNPRALQVLNMARQDVGKVTKLWGGTFQETISDADQFGITFPRDLPVEAKAVILGACILIDFMYFETAAGDD